MTILLSTPIPPPELIEAVAGHRDAKAYEQSRRVGVMDVLVPRLRACGFDPMTSGKVLDFGCGCGRLLAGWEGVRPGVLYGVDINPALVTWCQANIPFATVTQSGYMPPLDFPDATFGLVYSVSVFTHLSSEAARRWAVEMRRLIRPGGMLAVSFHGDWYNGELEKIGPNALEQLRRDGIVHHLFGRQEDTHLGSNNYATFTTRDFIEGMFKGFGAAGWYPGTEPTHFAAHQDTIFLRRV
jgi:SAM-dependent methyltransferase